MSGGPGADGVSTLREPGRFARLAQAAKNHPLLAIASALGSIGTFAAGMAAVAGLLGADGTPAIGEPIRADDLGLPKALSYSYEQVRDEERRISVQVPIAWDDWETDGWHAHSLPPIPEGKRIGPGLNAAPNVADWKNDLRTPGVFIGASEEILRTHSPRDVLDRISFTGCTKWARDTYSNGPFTGEVLTWNCPSAQWRLLAATPTESPSYLVYVQVKLVTTADVEAYNKILDTFEVDFGA